MADPVNYMLIPFKGNQNPGYSQDIKLYLQETKEIEKESDKLDISVLNATYIIYYFLSQANKYGGGSLALMA